MLWNVQEKNIVDIWTQHTKNTPTPQFSLKYAEDSSLLLSDVKNFHFCSFDLFFFLHLLTAISNILLYNGLQTFF